MVIVRIGFVIHLCAILTLVIGQPAHAADDTPAERPIVMVCLHGTVKSVMAAEYFNKEARERGLPFRSISRGVDPDTRVPNKIASALAADGIDVSNFEPRRLTPQEAYESPQLVAIGVDLSDFDSDAEHELVQWNDIPPASVDYEASKATMIVHIHELLDNLEKQASRQ